MRKPSTPTCEVMVDGAWRTLGLDVAWRDHRDGLKRCPICHGQVRLQGIFSGEGRAVLTHRRIHDGCALISKHYKGVPKRHPQALK